MSRMDEEDDLGGGDDNANNNNYANDGNGDNDDDDNDDITDNDYGAEEEMHLNNPLVNNNANSNNNSNNLTTIGALYDAEMEELVQTYLYNKNFKTSRNEVLNTITEKSPFVPPTILINLLINHWDSEIQQILPLLNQENVNSSFLMFLVELSQLQL